jgi:CelD/BcsL family acetyltransferase involved in cellulose biosynthesis
LIAALGIPTRGGDAPRVELVSGLEAYRDAWIELAESARNVFATWEWNDLWWRHYGDGRPLRIAVVRGEDDEVEAIVPLFLWSRRPLRTLRLIGHGHGDRLGPISRDGEAAGAVNALRLALATERHDVFVGDWLGGDRDWAGALGGRTVRTTGYPILPLREGSWLDFLDARSRRFRKSVRHTRNRLDRDHEVAFRAADETTLEADLDDAFRLHRARFRTHSGCLFCGAHERFQREFARVAFERGWLRLLLLVIDGAPVACEYGFQFQDAYFAYQGGRNPAWDRHSVGFLLEVESIRRALEEGATEYRFLGGEEGYKYRYPTHDPRLETVVAPATRRGRAAATGLATVLRLPGGKDLLRKIGSA